jgi:hypothetical protein
MVDAMSARPSVICRELLAALEASEGRRRRRKRDTTPDAIGLALKRALLEQAVADDPEPAAFEGWLLQRCLSAGGEAGAMRAMALDVLAEWRLATSVPEFSAWLDRGAPSDDVLGGPEMAPPNPPTLVAPRETRAAPRVCAAPRLLRGA